MSPWDHFPVFRQYSMTTKSVLKPKKSQNANLSCAWRERKTGWRVLYALKLPMSQGGFLRESPDRVETGWFEGRWFLVAWQQVSPYCCPLVVARMLPGCFMGDQYFPLLIFLQYLIALTPRVGPELKNPPKNVPRCL